MKKIRISLFVFAGLSVISAIISISGFVGYYYYRSMDMSADASGGGPVGLPYLLAMLAGETVGIYAAIFTGVNLVVVIILLFIQRRIKKRDASA